MAQFLTTSVTSSTSNRSYASFFSNHSKLLPIYSANGRLRSSGRVSLSSSVDFGHSVASSPLILLKSKRSPAFTCSAGNAQVTRPGNVLEVQDGEAMEKCIDDAADQMVVVSVSTTTCGPCKVIHPKMVKMSEEYPDVLFYKINGDKSNSTRALMRKWGIRAVPTFRFYRNGKLLHSHSGASEDELRAHFLTYYFSEQKVS